MYLNKPNKPGKHIKEIRKTYINLSLEHETKTTIRRKGWFESWVLTRKLCACLLTLFMITLACPVYTAISGERRPLPIVAIEGLLESDSSHHEEIADLIKECGVSFEETTSDIVENLKSLGANILIIETILNIAPAVSSIYVMTRKPNGTRLEAILIIDDNETKRYKTNDLIVGLSPGKTKIKIMGVDGYKNDEDEIEIKQGNNEPIDIILEPIPLLITKIEGFLKNNTSSTKIIKRIEELGVGFTLTPDNVENLKNLGADDLIINTILAITDPEISILYVDSDPSDKLLIIDGEDRGITPVYIVEHLPEELRISIKGDEKYEGVDKEEVQIVQGKINTIKKDLPERVGPSFSFITLNNIKPGNDVIVMPGKQVEVQADVVNKGSEPLTYKWESNGGYFLSQNTIGPANRWIAPFEEGNYTITVSINGKSRIYDMQRESITVNNSKLNYDLGKYKRFRFLTNKIGFGNNLYVLDVDFDSDNNMYILDPSGNCIRVFDPYGSYSKTLCYGKLATPEELLIKDNKIYVIHNKSDIERYNGYGKLEVAYNMKKKYKKDMTHIKKPVAFAVGNEDELYVIDGSLPNIAVFEKNGRFRLRFGNSGTETLVKPIAIDVDRKGYIYVLDSKKMEIIIYNPKMQFESTIKIRNGEYKDMAIDKDKNHLYLTNASDNNIHVIDSSGKSIGKFGYLENPFKVTIDKLSNIYVTNIKDNYINKFVYETDAYNYYGKFGTNAFKDIIDIAVDKNSSIFLLKGRGRGREIIKMSRDGWEMTRFGGKYTKGEKLIKPISIVAGKGGEYIYVLDKSSSVSKVLQFNNYGKFLRVITSQTQSGFSLKTQYIDSDKHGNVYLLDTKTRVCLIYNHKGELINQVETEKEEATSMKKILVGYKPINVAVERQGDNVYVLFKKAFSFGKNKRLINKYTRKHNYIGQRYIDDVDENTSILKVNNYRRVMAVDTPDTAQHVISFFIDGVLEQTSYGEDNFGKVKDIEVDGVENVYILDMESNVHIYKQENLRYDYTNTLLN